MSRTSAVQARRAGYLAAIAKRHTVQTHDPRTREQLRGVEPVSRWAAVTSEGHPESSFMDNGNLLVADSTDELGAILAKEAAEGWPTHGRVWDLDGEWDDYGNLSVVHRVVIISPSKAAVRSEAD